MARQRDPEIREKRYRARIKSVLRFAVILRVLTKNYSKFRPRQQ